MKTLVKHTSRRREYSFAAVLASLLLLGGACSSEDAIPAFDEETPVAFTAGIESVALPATQSPTPGTRTVIGADGEAAWTQGDRVGIFMYKAGGSVKDDIISGANNIAYSVDPRTGALSPDGTPIYYPKDQAVSFAAYHPYQSSTFFIDGPPIGDQTTVEKQSAVDYLYSDNAQYIQSSRNPVALEFRHLLCKIKFDITLGEGLAGGQITKVVMQSQHIGFTVNLRHGQVYQVNSPRLGPISMLKSTTPTAGTDATFTALIHRALEGAPIAITVNDTEYTGAITGEILDANTMYVYPVTVRKRDIEVGKPAIAPWTPNDHGTGEAVEEKKNV